MFTSYDMRGFGEYIRGVRKKLMYTQKEVEALTGLSCESLRKIESGLVVPRYETLEYLTQAYKTDVLNVFSLFRASHKLFDLYSLLDLIVVENNQEELKRLVDDFDKIIDEETQINLINVIELQQLRLIINGIRSYFSNPNKDDCIKTFIKAMRLSVSKFRIEIFEELKYSQLEQRILLLISIGYSKIQDYHNANKLLEHCLSISNFNNRVEFKDKLLLIKIYFNLSYNYHCLDDDGLTLEYATKGIQYCLNNHINYLLPGLLYRSGVCKFKLNTEGYISDLENSVKLLSILGNEKLANVYRDSIYEIYKITLPE